ncbi:MAG: hypothetical protein LW838_03160 [Nitrosomonadaceae bacterium]|nr:hypothetical protein [Nitrosomonadaceae bacterium]
MSGLAPERTQSRVAGVAACVGVNDHDLDVPFTVIVSRAEDLVVDHQALLNRNRIHRQPVRDDGLTQVVALARL